MASGSTFVNDSLVRSTSSQRSWAASTMTEVNGRSRRDEEEEELRWAAIERLPTYDRLRKALLRREMVDDGTVVIDEVDLTKLSADDKKFVMEGVLKAVEDDNEIFLKKLRDRIDSVGIEVPKIEVRYEHLSVEGEVHVGSRALPTLLNSFVNIIESILGLVWLAPTKKRKIKILRDINGLVKPSRMTLLLGPPGAGKTTLLLALAEKIDPNLKVSGRVTYCGHDINEFIPKRTCSYIGQHDLHQGEMTVRETLDFSGRCLGVGTRYELLAELSRREKQAGVKPDPLIDVFMKATSIGGQETSLVTDYVLMILGLDICADIMVGDDMRRGISGGQKKRLTTGGEMLVGPAKALFMDDISTGLDSSTTFQIIKFMRQMVHIMDVTMIVSLLQPAPETFNLFDDIILLSEGQIVYQGPRENILEFFEYMGFKCPDRKGVADFLQEVTSKKDQEQYWFRRDRRYTYISVPAFAQGFKSFHVGEQLSAELRVPYDKSSAHPAALVTEKYGISSWELFQACFSREWLLMKRNAFIYIFKTSQVAIMSLITMSVFFRTKMPHGHIADGEKFYGALFYSLIKMMFNGMAERELSFYPTWAFCLPIWVLRIPISLVESAIWIIITYYTIGFAPSASRFFKQFLAYFAIHQMSLSLFRFIAAVGRTEVIANTLGICTMLFVFLFGGFIISKNDIEPWMLWGYYLSPMMYGQNAIVMNEFLDERWSAPNPDPRVDAPTIGKLILKSRGFFKDEYLFWICIGALVGFSVVFNILFTVVLMYLNPFGDSKAVVADENDAGRSDKMSSTKEKLEGTELPENKFSEGHSKKGMVLPFQPLSLTFNHVNYSVDMPVEMKEKGAGDRLQLLHDVSGTFRPGILTALVGVSGAGKTTLMDVLAGRKTSGYTQGTICVSGYLKNQATFSRISGYCEQSDIHSPYVTVYESLLYSAWLRLSPDIKIETRTMFVEEVMELIELKPLRNAPVGLPGVDGLSTEQRKRLTIAVELVTNPSIIFMDEPTSGLDARAAAIVMRTVRNTVDTGRTVVCTIHQPSIDIFEAFDELLCMKRGGRVIYAGPLGRQSHKLIEYFEYFPGVPKIKDGYNPATWMLDVTASSIEAHLDVDFGDIYAKSPLYERNQKLIEELSSPTSGSKDVYFPTKYSQNFVTQFKACFWKQYWSYWRNPQYNSIRFFMTTMIGGLFGIIFWNKGDKIQKQQDLFNLLGALYAAVMFIGAANTLTVIPIVAVERRVFYRERAAGMYSALPYAFAQVAVETIYVGIQSLVYALLLYSMIGFEWTFRKFIWFYYYILMCFIYFTLYGMMLVALTPDRNIATVVMSFWTSLWNLFSGFLIPRPHIPIWWRWYYWASPVAWTLYGLVTSQVGDKNTELEIPGAVNMPLKLFLKESLGFEYEFLPVVAVAHIGWVLLFVLVFAYGIKYLNFQRR